MTQDTRAHPGDLQFDHIVQRLVEMGKGAVAVPVVEASVLALQEQSGDEGGFELEDLLRRLGEDGHADVAAWMAEAIEYLCNHGAPETAAGARGALRGGVVWSAAPHVDVLFDGGSRVTLQMRGYESLDDLRFRVAHAFEGGREVRRLHYAPIANLVHSGERVLDIGCGDGTFLELVRERGARGVGLDLDPLKVAECRAKGLDVRESRVQDMSWDEEPVDFVAMIQIIEHMDTADALSLLDAVWRRLSPSGRVFIVTPNFANPFVAHSNFWLDITHVRPYPEALLRTMCDCLGFPYVQSGTMGDGMDTWCYGFRKPASRAAGV